MEETRTGEIKANTLKLSMEKRRMALEAPGMVGLQMSGRSKSVPIYEKR